MLILARRPGEGLVIRLDPSVNPSTPIGEILGRDGIQVRVITGRNGRLRIGIDAPSEFEILRDEHLVALALQSSG
jgi:sRNA-binding carbon storage regulator CsrA